MILFYIKLYQTLNMKLSYDQVNPDCNINFNFFSVKPCRDSIYWEDYLRNSDIDYARTV